MGCVMRLIHATAEASVPREPTVLSLEGMAVTFTTPAGEVAAVRDVSLHVARGECLGVVGESGAGKSQAFLAAMGLLAANGRAVGKAVLGSGGAPAARRSSPPPVDLLTLRGAALDRIRGARIGMVFQDPMTSLTPHIAVGDQVAEPMVRHLGLSWREARARALALLQRVHVTDAPQRSTQFPHELSGGMRQRVMIAIALACDPELLIADEPTTALDVTLQAQILSLLAELKRERGMAMVLITHDFGAIAGIADRVAVMQAGEVVELDTVGVVMKLPRHPYTQALLRALSPQGIPSLAGLPVAASAGVPTLRISRLRVQFPVSRGWLARSVALRAVDDVSFDLHPGEALGVVGESGSGKSTLARAALRLLRPDAGQIVWLGKPVASLSTAALKPLRHNLQIVFQDPLASLDPRMTVGESVAEPLRVHRPELSAAERTRAVADMLVRVGISADLVTRYPHEFSGGQCQRIGIARAMILRPRLLVCDEAVSALDVTIQGQIVALLADLKREYGMSVLFVSHNLAVVRRLCDRVLVLYLGRMMELAPVEQLYAEPRHPYTRELLEAVPIPDPDLQPARLGRVLGGEPPSPLNPPSGCVYRTRCPHVAEVCRNEIPAWEEQVACHRWREVARSTS
jgi:oligopeptide/dipeptide ABC transporter ATP-binding protein